MTVRAWAGEHLHFSHRVSSRVEGAHSTLNSYLQVSTGDLMVVYDKISLLLVNRFAEFDAAIDHNKIRIPHTARDPILYTFNRLSIQFRIRKTMRPATSFNKSSTTFSLFRIISQHDGHALRPRNAAMFSSAYGTSTWRYPSSLVSLFASSSHYGASPFGSKSSKPAR
jgi:hypothetical protein